MTARFDYFVIFADMRTGSNFLEENINAFAALKSWGEVFNPVFVGKAKATELLGVTLADREADPFTLLTKIQAETDGTAGFRFFHDHDPRILDHVLADPRCAKVILTRNPLDSYVSRKIAGETGQWRLADLKDAKSAQVAFDRVEFDAFLSEIKSFQQRLLRGLQTSGQTAFYIAYEDLQDMDVINGLARFLGADEAREKTRQKTKVQNPSGLEDKVTNYDEMVRSLASVDHFNLSRTPNFEPRRHAGVPAYIAGATTPLMYLPIRGACDDVIPEWLAALDGVEQSALQQGFTQKTLRQWKRANRPHRSFTVVRHPVARLHTAFCRHILADGETGFPMIRETLREVYKLRLPEDFAQDAYSAEAHRLAFIRFAEFVKGNLGGQTSVRVDVAWASQSEIIKGFGEFMLPDAILRDDRLAADLPALLAPFGPAQIPPLPAASDDTPHALGDIYNEDVEAAVRAAYQRDYMMFGFGDWA